jgi:AcrR family transcriptional regulator
MVRESAPHPARRSLSRAPGRRERRRAEIHEKLYRAALKLFAERGYSATTVEDITEAADVGKGTFFNYFPSKEHLLMAFSDIRMEKLRLALDEARRGNRLIRDVLYSLFHGLVKEASQTQEMARSMLITVLNSEPVRNLARVRMARGRGEIAEIISIGQQREEIRADRHPDALARLFQQVQFGSLFFWAVEQPTRFGPRLDSSFEQFWLGIEADHTQPGKRKAE